MALFFIYDDTVPVPTDVYAAAGIRRFGDLIYRKMPLARSMQKAAEKAGLAQFIHCRSPEDIVALRGRAASAVADTRYIYFPSNLIGAGPKDEFTRMLENLCYLHQNLLIPVEQDEGGWRGVALVDRPMMLRFLDALAQDALTRFLDDAAGDFARIDNEGRLACIASKSPLLQFLTSQFEARHFNGISSTRYGLRKTSTDKLKLRREYDYYYMLPDSMKHWLVQPFDFRDDDGQVSYAMERLNVPDMSVQWIHGALSEREFGDFLDRAFHFLSERPVRRVDHKQAEVLRDLLYERKLRERLAELQRHPLFGAFDALTRSGCDGRGVVEIVDRYLLQYAASRRKRQDTTLVVSHGDFCFSNILFEKSIGLMRLIDPRGAVSADELYMDPLYDVAKLSHSILGHYDLINNGLFELRVENELKLNLSTYEPANAATLRRAFRKRLTECGYHEKQVRLYEASLFLSMVPLHMDVPVKALAFILNGSKILDLIEAGG
jgi:hypothetical protein